MADDFDVEAMLEAPYQKNDDRDDDRDRGKGRDHDRDRRRPNSRSRDRGGDRDRRRRSSRERRRSRSRDRDPRKRRSPDKGFRRSGDNFRDANSFRNRRSRSMSPLRPSTKKVEPEEEVSPEEKDARTVFCMQLSARIRPRDLQEFFSSIGQVRDVRLITDNKTRRSKGIAYIEFKDVDSIPLAMGLTGQKLLGIPILVQASQAEKNRAAGVTAPAAIKSVIGPMRLYVGSLHFNITEDMLKAIFEPFGKIEEIKLIRDHESGKSHGYGFVSFQHAEEAKKALEQLNGFEVAGRPMKVNHVTERIMEAQAQGQMTGHLDTDELDRAGIDLGATGRLQLMAKLAEGTGFQIPPLAANALNMNPNGEMAVMNQLAQMNQMMSAQPPPPPPQMAMNAPPIATQCFMLSNMFQANQEVNPRWDQEIRDDVIDECNKHGGVLHIYVDKASPQANVYVKCPSIAAAVSSVNALHGRFFSGKVITAAYVPLPNYHALFAEAIRANQLLLPSTQSLQMSMPGMQAGLMR